MKEKQTSPWHAMRAKKMFLNIKSNKFSLLFKYLKAKGEKCFHEICITSPTGSQTTFGSFLWGSSRQPLPCKTLLCYILLMVVVFSLQDCRLFQDSQDSVPNDCSVITSKCCLFKMKENEKEGGREGVWENPSRDKNGNGRKGLERKKEGGKSERVKQKLT